LRKGGAGGHNWGSYQDELEHEADLLDEDYEGDELVKTGEEAGGGASGGKVVASESTSEYQKTPWIRRWMADLAFVMQILSQRHPLPTLWRRKPRCDFSRPLF
jgi:hypothetical protein